MLAIAVVFFVHEHCSRNLPATLLMEIDYTPEYSPHDLELLDSLDFLIFQYNDAVKQLVCFLFGVSRYQNLTL